MAEAEMTEAEAIPSAIKCYIKSVYEFSKYVTKNLDGKKLSTDTHFGFNCGDEIIEVDGVDVRTWEPKSVKKLLKKGQGLFGHIFAIVVARPSGPNYEKIMSMERVSCWIQLLSHFQCVRFGDLEACWRDDRFARQTPRRLLCLPTK